MQRGKGRSKIDAGVAIMEPLKKTEEKTEEKKKEVKEEEVKEKEVKEKEAHDEL
jgi:hypothetical protein